ncbi:sigma factor [Streptomyces sp. DT190]|uniref:sigma factor n=1 Tax=unclassified Streptomyces TaxID=2593676 RepID=UPI003CFAFE0B
MKEAVYIGGSPSSEPDLQELVGRVALGDEDAFASVYDAVAGSVLGVVRAVLRDPAQSEEVAQEVLVEVWRTAPRYRPDRGTAINWILTPAHRRAVDRVRSVEGESYTVNDSAKVVCGNVKTANANVHIIDSVLMPAS